MGSGPGGLYSGTGSSQPYADFYKVINKELQKDKTDPDIYNNSTGYFKNPTATSLESAISNNSIYIDGKIANGEYTYVMDSNGDIIFAKRCNPNDSRKRSPHPTLIGGKNPKVQVAGMITFKNGKIFSVNNQSGHYRPHLKSMEKVDNELKSLYEKNPNVFDKKSKWRNQ